MKRKGSRFETYFKDTIFDQKWQSFFGLGGGNAHFRDGLKLLLIDE